MTQEEIIVLMKTDPQKGMIVMTELYTALVWKVVWGKLSGVSTSPFPEPEAPALGFL